jgi:uncharacterized protein YciI
MEHFLVVAHDALDGGAGSRRAAAREDHLAGIQQLLADGSFIFGGGLLDDAGEVIGSVLVMRFEDRAAFDDWLAADPYTTTKVWGDVDVRPCRPAAIPNAPWERPVVA